MKNNLNLTPFAKKLTAMIVVLLMYPPVAQAHVLPGEGGNFLNGLGHPLHGLDHVLAMVAVGLWAMQMGGRTVWLLPAVFLSVMSLGGLLGLNGVRMPFVEQGIVLSVLVLGVLIAWAARLPWFASVALVGLFALVHGHAHGAEMPSGASAFAFGSGFLAATAALHACGMTLGLLLQKLARLELVRAVGAGIAVVGLVLWIG